MNWPLKYRPKKISDLALKEVSHILEQLNSSNNFPQAFLFAGPKGTGKTSTSRIIASLLNDNLDEDEINKIFLGKSYIVQELDAASNRGIDDIRALKDKIYLPPAVGKKSVYILDEAHMLTREAFNALLKVLEEPPEHVVFILATTELHKIPETIISRCNLIKFRKANQAELIKILEKILKQEKIEYDLKALELIAKQANGSFRDGLKLLEFASSGKEKLELANLSEIYNLDLEQDLVNLLKFVIAKKEPEIIKIINKFRQNNLEPNFVYQTLFDLLHQNLLKLIQGEKSILVKLDYKITLFFLKTLQPLPQEESGLIPLLALELKLLEIIFKAKSK